jgi:hypothetical protein
MPGACKNVMAAQAAIHASFNWLWPQCAYRIAAGVFSSRLLTLRLAWMAACAAMTEGMSAAT